VRRWRRWRWKRREDDLTIRVIDHLVDRISEGTRGD